eukprot:Blabericola_migrator_1__3724@NODE_2114_length_3249_cov_615_548397_g1339_i0_p2_GENE_NODE_2114_length_3249_cov_615_548397_g1339_i0NODE_2114_length_3249_cov_615_548397_g1339_i0_p2_ORF_typecomplete_len401_score43_49LPMO_10/PF03067_15/3_9e22LPMO_10/PF03067_15/3_1e03KAR9/PF08580_10/6_2_NODE_2114_length_3249_cov_615_548397_g1339_i019993201
MKSLSLILLAGLALFTQKAEAHGAMISPQSRNMKTTHYCPQCANGSGVCGAGSDGQWPADTSASAQLDGSYTTSLTSLTPGGTVEVEVYITAAHMGHFVVELCPNPGSTITDDCFTTRLERDPTDERYAPYLSSDPTVTPFVDNSCATTFTQSSPLKVRYLVPNNISSNHAILRWYWQTGNSCKSMKMPSSASSWSASINGQTCKIPSSSASSCGSNCPTSSCSGEQFKNCADVKISGSSSSGNSSSSGGSSSGNSKNSASNISSGSDVKTPTNPSSSSSGSGSSSPSNNSASSSSNQSSSQKSKKSKSRSNGSDSDSSERSSAADAEAPVVDWTADIAKCKRKLTERSGVEEGLCDTLCEKVGALGAAEQTHCVAANISRLHRCVTKMYGSVCRRRSVA